MKKKQIKTDVPIEIRNSMDSDEPLKSLTIHYGESWSHYAVIWQIVEKLVKNKFASRKEIVEEFKTILESLF